MPANAQTRELLRRIANLEDWRRRSKTPQLGNSTVVGGALQISDIQDLLTMLLGQQFDGTNAPSVLTGPPPPAPSIPGVEPIIGGLRVYWDGTFADGAVAPMDFLRVTIHAAPSAGFVEFDPTDQSKILGEFGSATGSETVVALPSYDEHVVALFAWTLAGKFSPVSEIALGTAAQVDIPDISDEINDAINDAQDTADAALTSANGKNKVYFQDAKPTGGTYIEGDTWFDTNNDNKIHEYALTPSPDFYPVEFGTNALGDGAITAAKILDATITNAKIADATIQSAKIAALDAAKITTGSLDAARIAARSLTVDKLLVTGTENLIPDPKFAAPLGTTWNSGANWSVDPTGGRDGLNALVATHTTGATDTNNIFPNDASGGLPCVAGATYRMDVWVKGSVTGSTAAAWAVRWKNTAGTWAVSQSAAIAIATAGVYTLLTYMWTAPSDAVAFRPGVRVPSAAATGTYAFADPSVVRAANSELIVDGAIISDKLAANSVVAGKVAAGTIDTNELAAGAVTAAKIEAGTITAAEIAAGSIDAASLSATAIDGKTITGATLQTDSAGNRIVVRDDGSAGIVEFFGPDGEAGYLNPATGKIEFTSPRSAAQVTAGYDKAYMYLGGQSSSISGPLVHMLTPTTERYGNGSVGGDINMEGELRARHRLFVEERDTHVRTRTTDMNLATDSTWRTVAWQLEENTTTADPNEEIVYSTGEFFVFDNRTYLVTMFINFSGADVDGKRGARITASPTGSSYTTLASHFVPAAPTGQTHLSVTVLVDQGFGLIRPEVYQDSGSTIQVMEGSRVTVRRLF